MNPGMINSKQAREIRRRPTSNAPSNLSEESLVVSMKRASEPVQNDGTARSFARMLVRTYKRMGILSNNDLHLTLCKTRDNENLEGRFMDQFNEASGGCGITERQVCCFRNTAMYMNMR